MPISAHGKALVRLGVITLGIAALAAVWELLALQAPGTPLYIGMLPSPVAVLRELSSVVGLLLLAAGLTQSWARGPGETALLVLLALGTLLGVGAQAYGAFHGMTVVQLRDLRPDALPLFVVKHAGLALLGIGLLEHGRRLLVREPPAGNGSLLEQAVARAQSRGARSPGRSARQLDPEGREP